MVHSYTLNDILWTIAIIPVFAIFMFTPGYSFGWATNPLRFRDSSVTKKLLLSVPFSIVVSTVLANIAGRYIPTAAILWIFIAMAAAVAVHGVRYWIIHRKNSCFALRRSTKIVLFLAGLWALVVIASLVDLKIGDKLYVNTALWDHAIRIAFLNSAIRSGVPPGNPFSYLGYVPAARYYYYWYVLCSYPARLTHINARYVLYGSSVWAGFSLAALIPIYLTDFFGIKENVRRKAVLGILLISVTGLDIVPTLYEFLRARFVNMDIELWDPVVVESWGGALIWVPHHVAALVACFIGFLALWSVRMTEEKQQSTHMARTVAGSFAAFAFAASAGLSVYVTFTFALFLLFWGIRLLSKREFADFLLYLGTACFTVFLSLPYLHDLLPPATGGGPSHGAKAGGFLALSWRVLPNFLSTPYFLKVRGFEHPALFAPFGIVAVYVLEFGFFVIVGWKRLRQDVRNRPLNEAEIASWYLVAISLLIITCIRSLVIANNDLASRGAMILQFILLLWGAEYLDRWIFVALPASSNCINVGNAVIFAALALGFIGTLYSLTIMRTYAIWDDIGMISQPVDWLPQPPNIGKDLLDIRQAYQNLNQILPSNSIVQYNPMTVNYLPLLEYDKFQSVDAFPDCGADFGGDVSRCAPVQDAIANLFNKKGNYNIHELCSRLSIDVLVARKSDPAWRDRTSWVWTNPPVVENSYIRAFRCR